MTDPSGPTGEPPRPRVDPTLWTSAEAGAATGARVHGRWSASGVSIDTRTLAPGDLFVALSDARDGHDFVADAMAKGAAGALVSRSGFDAPGLTAPDTLAALRGLAVAARDRSPAIRIAVTGSVGKTSVKDALACVLAQAGRAHWSLASYNNHWGVPLSLARMPRDTERAVFEMGMNHAGEIRDLTRLVRPDVAVITKIAPAHIEALGSLEGIADAKAEVFEGLTEWGAAVIPGDDDFAQRLAEAAGAAGAGWLVRFGAGPACESRLIEFGPSGALWKGKAEVFGRLVSFEMEAAGPHAGLNAAAILASAYLAHAPLDVAADALRLASIPKGRGRALSVSVGGGEATVIDDSYNANPASVSAAVAALGARPIPKGGRRILALGEMRELGSHGPALHAAVAQDVERAGLDLVFACGEGTRPLVDALPAGRCAGWWPNAGELASNLGQSLQAGDAVLVKGSNASNMASVVESLTRLAR